MRFQRKRRERVDITLISMIDVLFVLLLFFMVSTTFDRHTELKINLPEAKGSEAEDHPKNITMEIDAKGVYNLVASDGQSHILPDQNRETLTRELLKLAYQAKDLPFIIKANDNTPNKAVMTVLDVAGQVGFSHITFPTQEPKTQE
ncbi:biopolymer transporter ExbD [Methyloglobulus sp.]|uniref:ExbD/TolR family protein n=1 Tax=Methyloglobulus sp. TaxID=2518622 RepID=UPI0032B74F53